MIDNLAIGAVTFDNVNYLLTRVLGMGYPSVENTGVKKPLNHGEILINSLLRRRNVLLEGVIGGSTNADLDDKVDALLTELNINNAPLTFTFDTYNSENLQIYVTVKSFDVDQEPGTLNWVRFRLELEAFDALLYSQAQASATIQVSSVTGGTAIPTAIPMDLSSGAGSGYTTITNNGNFNALPVFTIYGPGTGLHVRNVTADKAIFIDDTLTVSDYVTVDVANRTVKRNGSLDFSIFPLSQNDWVEILAGANSFFMYADSGSTSDTHADCVFRHTWVGL